MANQGFQPHFEAAALSAATGLFIAGLVGGPEAAAAEGGSGVAEVLGALGFRSFRSTRGAIGASGRVGEQALKALGGESQVFFRTSNRGRFVDQLVNGIAHESKVGYTTLTKDIA